MPYGFDTGNGQWVVAGYQPASTSWCSSRDLSDGGTATGMPPNCRMASTWALGTSSCVRTTHWSPARAAYAAAATPWLPVDWHTIRVTPSAAAAVIATD